MSIFDSMRAAFKGGAGTPVPLARSFTSPWALAFERAGTRSPFEYRTAVRHAFVENPVAQRAVRIIAEGVGNAPLAPAEPEAMGLIASTSAGQSLLEGGLKWQSLSLSPADMDFAELKAAAARDIALAFGVPPMLLGLPGDNTYANYREANRALWRLTLLPLAGKILTSLQQGLQPWFPDLELKVDLDRAPALADDREKLWAEVSAADFLDDGEKRAMLGLPAREAKHDQ